MALLNAWEVSARAMGRSTSMGQELSVLLMVYVVFLAAPYALRNNTHVRMDLVTSNLDEDKAKALKLISLVIVFLIGSLFAVEGSREVLRAVESGHRSAGILRLPMWVLQLAIPFGGLGLMVEAVLGALGQGRFGENELESLSDDEMAD